MKRAKKLWSRRWVGSGRGATVPNNLRGAADAGQLPMHIFGGRGGGGGTHGEDCVVEAELCSGRHGATLFNCRRVIFTPACSHLVVFLTVEFGLKLTF